jgi:exodeoxyribonuclease VII large subunit
MLRAVTQLPIFGLEGQIWSVADLTRYIRQTLESDYRLQDLWVTGETFNVSRPSSGHLYFTLKDEQASLRCVMWRSDVARQPTLPRDGEAIEVHGHISVYEVGGQYQLYADAVRRAGEGELLKEFLRLKDRLEAEGLFDPERKRPLPAWPKRIGVVTSPTGAALRDVLHVFRRRFPLLTLILAPTPVQGKDAPPGIVAALQALNQVSQPDVILLVRGGGSIEDLWAFNDEGVARAIAASEAPVISGIGHETDIVISDFVADVRAATPSAAAEVATPDRKVLARVIIDERVEIGRIFRERLLTLRRKFETLRADLQLASPRASIAGERQRLDGLAQQAFTVLRHTLVLRRTAIGGAMHTLDAVGPSAVLARGYAVVTRLDDGAVVRSVDQVTDKQALNVRVSDGTFDAQVTSSHEEDG